ncbi:MAG: ureidoglycolate lyase [Pseudomonadales bacterium]|nr:ureidoglycolate lyase [Pseudomonadales bacterium]
MTKITLHPEPLTSSAFAPFGDVVAIGERDAILINDGNTERFDSLAKVESCGEQASVAINIFRAQARQLPMAIHMMERHPLGSQSFHPLSGEPYLVLVANPVEVLTPEDLKLFLAQPDQGINYHRNTWHHPVLALNKTCDFLVVDRKGQGKNCEEFHFDRDTKIEIALSS